MLRGKKKSHGSRVKNIQEHKEYQMYSISVQTNRIENKRNKQLLKTGMKSKSSKNWMTQWHSTIVNPNRRQTASKTQTQKRLVLFNNTNREYVLQAIHNRNKAYMRSSWKTISMWWPVNLTIENISNFFNVNNIFSLQILVISC